MHHVSWNLVNCSKTVWKIPLKKVGKRLVTLKVTRGHQICAIQHAIYPFLFVVCSNNIAILHRIRHYYTHSGYDCQGKGTYKKDIRTKGKGELSQMRFDGIRTSAFIVGLITFEFVNLGCPRLTSQYSGVAKSSTCFGWW